MADPTMKRTEEDRLSQGQSLAKGDTGDGVTGVPAQEQGISNRPGDRDRGDDEDPVERSEDRLADDEDDSDDDMDEDASDEPESEPDRF
jgi:hypothetical protein